MCCREDGSGCFASTVKVNGYECTSSGNNQSSNTCASLGGVPSCPSDYHCTTLNASDGTCYAIGSRKSCEELGFNTMCPTGSYCGNKNSYGCYEVQGKIGETCGEGKKWTSNGCENSCSLYTFFNTDNERLGDCTDLSSCKHMNTCASWDISNNGCYYTCTKNTSIHANCCSGYNQSGVNENDYTKNPNNYVGCTGLGGTWTCTPQTPAPSQSPTPSPSNSPKPSNSPSPEPSNSPTPETPTPSQSPTPSKSCYECTLNGKTQHVYATSAANAASAATTLKGVTASNCKTTDNKNCEAIKVKNCYECDVNGTKKTTTAYSETEAASNVNGKNCTIVSANKCNVPVNPKTGTIAIIVAWIVGILTIGYSLWYFKKSQTL